VDSRERRGEGIGGDVLDAIDGVEGGSLVVVEGVVEGGVSSSISATPYWRFRRWKALGRAHRRFSGFAFEVHPTVENFVSKE